MCGNPFEDEWAALETRLLRHYISSSMVRSSYYVIQRNGSFGRSIYSSSQDLAGHTCWERKLANYWSSVSSHSLLMKLGLHHLRLV